MHGSGNLAKAIKLLPKQDRDDFENFVTIKFHLITQYVYLQLSRDTFEYYNAVFLGL